MFVCVASKNINTIWHVHLFVGVIKAAIVHKFVVQCKKAHCGVYNVSIQVMILLSYGMYETSSRC